MVEKLKKLNKAKKIKKCQTVEKVQKYQKIQKVDKVTVDRSKNKDYRQGCQRGAKKGTGKKREHPKSERTGMVEK